MKKTIIYFIIFLISLNYTFASSCVGANFNFTCGSSVNESCVLDGNLSAPTNCLSLVKDGITFDCAGYSIIGEDPNAIAVGVSVKNDTTIKNCHISGFDTGIGIEWSVSGTIENNVLENNHKGVYIHSESINNIIINNTARNCTHAFYDNSDGRNNYTLNTAEYSVNGFWINSAQNCLFENNIARSNSDTGFYIFYAANNTIQNNLISGNSYGFLFEASQNNTIVNNTLINNDLDFQSQGGSENNLTNQDYVLHSADISVAWDASNLILTDDTNNSVYINHRIIAVNSSAAPELNTTATITLTFDGYCPVQLYYYNQFTTDINQIILNGQVCDELTTPPCTNIQCSDGSVTFTVDHFDDYGAGDGAVPELSDIAFILAIAGVLGMFVYTRRKNY